VKKGSPPINIQDPFFFQLRREATEITIHLLSGQTLNGVLLRYDRYALQLIEGSRVHLVYKHAIADVVVDQGNLEGL
jgi:RNA chaperone Hfq